MQAQPPSEFCVHCPLDIQLLQSAASLMSGQSHQHNETDTFAMPWLAIIQGWHAWTETDILHPHGTWT
jgi:hypothetical protein